MIWICFVGVGVDALLQRLRFGEIETWEEDVSNLVLVVLMFITGVFV